MAVERTIPDAETSLEAILEPVGAIEPPKRPRTWPETTPISGLTPKLPELDEE